ncbi:cytidylate kinase [Actinopolyspora xinjiangensis]|uniref:Cytidylate kinase n=1 Tax=Actinopolyspora xinjiangensis TaxID=405564 RepID=A0A1H0WSP5_9ACTN|nr:(d)CMP kinase [Actinopolyspora xinjiangensis]SDP93703.1 cytidylate kinase [Actinopolyspora xinjiangensis]
MSQPELNGIVAVDGPSGTGKSTAARGLARALGAAYLDTGAMYRAVTLAVLRAGVALDDATGLARVAGETRLGMRTHPDDPGVLLDGVDVRQEIREQEVTGAVSAVSAVPEIRELLVERQRSLIDASTRPRGGIVVEGRDVGTVVAPDAGLKVYLTASADARAHRRTAQDAAEGRPADRERVHADVRRRDTLDSNRAVAPLRMAEDAVSLDTTELSLEQVLSRLRELADGRGLLVTDERAGR